jgi:exodeoxyribonuclease VII large subunit
MLAAEGLFAEALKKPLPFLPRIVGVVTSPTGAVIRDILHRLEDRFPSHVLVWPVRVQGESCAAEVAAGIAGFNGFVVGGPMPRPDLIIVARGGGSLEDLWGFNEEIVARAAHASVIPLISAVGHETDWTIIDFVADWRAPTPTAAAERAVPVRAELIIAVRGFGVRAGHALRRLLDGQRTHLQAISRGLLRKSDILGLPRQRLDTLSARLPRALIANARVHHTGLSRCASRLRPHLVAGVARLGRDRLARLERSRRRAGLNLVTQARGRFDNQAKLLSTLSYQNVLARGFTLVRDEEGRMLRRAVEVKSDAHLDIQFADGHVPVTADADGQRNSASPTKSRPPKDKPKDKPKPKQGKLL